MKREHEGLALGTGYLVFFDSLCGLRERQAFESSFSRPFALLTRVHREHREKQTVFLVLTPFKVLSAISAGSARD
jgi:hypothetical protein